MEQRLAALVRKEAKRTEKRAEKRHAERQEVDAKRSKLMEIMQAALQKLVADTEVRQPRRAAKKQLCSFEPGERYVVAMKKEPSIEVVAVCKNVTRSLVTLVLCFSGDENQPELVEWRGAIDALVTPRLQDAARGSAQTVDQALARATFFAENFEVGDFVHFCLPATAPAAALVAAPATAPAWNLDADPAPSTARATAPAAAPATPATPACDIP